MYTKLKVTEMGRMTPQEFKQSQKTPLAVVLDHVRSLYNVGSIFRTADAMRLSEVILCGITATPPNTEIHKTALGAEDTVAWQYFPTALDAVHALKQQGYTVYSIEQCEGSTPLQTLQTLPSPSLQGGGGISANEDTNEQSNYSLPVGRVRGGSAGSFALILGNEVKGVHQEVVDASDGCIEIPQYGTKHSLNVSTTAGIVIWEFAKRLLM